MNNIPLVRKLSLPLIFWAGIEKMYKEADVKKIKPLRIKYC